MAMTPLTVVFLGTLALLATLGLFYDFEDPYENVLVGFLSSVLWGFFAFSSMDVVVRDAPIEDATASMGPLMWVGVGLALLTAFFALYDLFVAMGREAETTTVEDVVGPR